MKHMSALQSSSRLMHGAWDAKCVLWITRSFSYAQFFGERSNEEGRTLQYEDDVGPSPTSYH